MIGALLLLGAGRILQGRGPAVGSTEQGHDRHQDRQTHVCRRHVSDGGNAFTVLWDFVFVLKKTT
jgi:hypothetical protein